MKIAGKTRIKTEGNPTGCAAGKVDRVKGNIEEMENGPTPIFYTLLTH